MTAESLLSLEDLVIRPPAGPALVRNLSLRLDATDCVGLVGASGSGKTLTALAILGLLPRGMQVAGRILFNGQDLNSTPALVALRGAAIGMVFQNPRGSLNPLRRVGRQLSDSIALTGAAGRQAKTGAKDLLAEVGLPGRHRAYPHELSGGQCQRVMLALALARQPRLLIADEPTSALDSVAQGELLDLLAELRVQRKLALLLISHDSGVVSRLADRVVYIQAQGAEPVPLDSPPPALDAPNERAEEPLLEADGLAVRFTTGRGRRRCVIAALSNASLALRPARTLALVGESGSGKTTLARAMLGLQRLDTGQVRLGGQALAGQLRQQRLASRRQLQIIFQDPDQALNPRQTVLQALIEPLRLHHGPVALQSRAEQLLQRVELGSELLSRFPHQLSGGQRQRVAIARALAVQPRVLVCDEPVSSLDAGLRMRTLTLLKRLQVEDRMALLLIAHDLDLVRGIADEVAVMHAGEIVEQGPAERVLNRPSSQVTRALLQASSPSR